ncbi:hypothetical protein [Acidianus infernus]|nr:hypothetical protein [Acidianus infernus]
MLARPIELLEFSFPVNFTIKASVGDLKEKEKIPKKKDNHPILDKNNI